MYGQGAYSFVNLQQGGGGGGTVIGARNATSDVGNFVELGLNPLIHDTFFDLAGFFLDITGKGIFDCLVLEDTVGLESFYIGTSGNVQVAAFGLDHGGQALFDVQKFQPRVVRGLHLDFNNSLYQLGEVLGAVNGTYLSIDDTAQTVDFLQATTGKEYFHLDFGLNTLDIGDHLASVNGYKVSMDIGNRDFAINDTAGLYVDFFTGAGQYQIGDLSNLVSGMKMLINVTSTEFLVEGSVTAQRLLALSVLTGDYSIGDLDNIANGSRLEIHDTTQHFDFVTNAGGVIGTFRADGLQTTSPTGGITAHKAWQFGDHVAAVVAFDAANYLEVNVNGTLYKLALAS